MPSPATPIPIFTSHYILSILPSYWFLSFHLLYPHHHMSVAFLFCFSPIQLFNMVSNISSSNHSLISLPCLKSCKETPFHLQNVYTYLVPTLLYPLSCTVQISMPVWLSIHSPSPSVTCIGHPWIVLSLSCSYFLLSLPAHFTNTPHPQQSIKAFP